MSKHSVIQNEVLCYAMSYFISSAVHTHDCTFVTVTDKLSQIHGDLWQNAKFHGNGLNSRILRIQ